MVLAEDGHLCHEPYRVRTTLIAKELQPPIDCNFPQQGGFYTYKRWVDYIVSKDRSQVPTSSKLNFILE
jgi:hypothetical protein